MTRLLIALWLLGGSAHAQFMTGGWDYEARKWQVMASTNGGTLSAKAYTVGTTFMQSAKRWDVRRYMGRVNLYLGTDTNAMVCPIIGDWFSSSFIPDQLVAFVAADYDETTGLTGNGTTKYLLCNGANAMAMGNHTTITNVHMAVYNRTASSQSGYAMGVSYGANSIAGLPLSYANVSYLELALVANQIGVADTNGVGLYMSTRSGSNRNLWKNTTSITNSTTGTGVFGAGIATVVHAMNAVGSVNNWNSRAFSYYCYGFGVPDAKVPAYYQVVYNVQQAYNRQ